MSPIRNGCRRRMRFVEVTVFQRGLRRMGSEDNEFISPVWPAIDLSSRQLNSASETARKS